MFDAPSTRQQEARFRQSLQVIPVHNTEAKVLPTTVPDELEIEIRLRYASGLMRILRQLLNLHSTKHYILDGIGKRVYESVDGKKTFEQIIDEFAAREKLTFFESRALLGQYFQNLTRRGLIIATLHKREERQPMR